MISGNEGVLVSAILVFGGLVLLAIGPGRWREMRCKHEWEHLGRMNTYSNPTDKMPADTVDTYRCTSCGVQRKYKL